MADTLVDIVLIDDHPLFTRGLELLLATAAAGRVRLVGSTADAAMAVDLVRRHRPDVAVLDLAMPPPGGHAAIRAVKRSHPAVRILALSGLTDTDQRLQALRDGADGFLPKTSEPEDLLHPLMALVDGYSVLPSELLRGLLNASDRPGGDIVDDLDEDDRRLWAAIARGDSTEDIAAHWIVSQRTAKRMVAALLRRIGARNRIHAAALAGRSGLLDD
jgi:two-component system, NarL family, nitrate/nitrite response regulator NarL